MAGVQRARARARGGPGRPAARAREVLLHLLQQPRRVLHGPGRRPARPDRRRHRDPAAGRPHAVGDDRRDPPHRRRARAAPEPARGARAAAGARQARDPHHRPRRCRPVRARRARRALPAPDLPRPHAAGGRARAAVPLHLEPVAVARRDRPRPCDPPGRLRAREGAQGDPPALRPGRRRPLVRAARGPHLQEPEHALPGHGDRRRRRLPGHPRRGLHGLRRGRRPAPGRRGRAATAALRRGRPRRGRRRAWTRRCATCSPRRWAPRRRTSSRPRACSTSRTRWRS